MMNAINAMNVIDGFAGEAATQRAGTAAQTTTPATGAKKKKNADKEQQKPKKKKDNPFRGMFDR
jgi:ribosomal protein L12E/L44/L45/RPP1/RPP2